MRHEMIMRTIRVRLRVHMLFTRQARRGLIRSGVNATVGLQSLQEHGPALSFSCRRADAAVAMAKTRQDKSPSARSKRNGPDHATLTLATLTLHPCNNHPSPKLEVSASRPLLELDSHPLHPSPWSNNLANHPSPCHPLSPCHRWADAAENVIDTHHCVLLTKPLG